MKSEKEKMLLGELYNPGDKELIAERHEARLLFRKINTISNNDTKLTNNLFRDLFGKTGKGLFIEPPFYCDYGYNITVGKKHTHCPYCNDILFIPLFLYGFNPLRIRPWSNKPLSSSQSLMNTQCSYFKAICIFYLCFNDLKL